jgi:hypothetical protein
MVYYVFAMIISVIVKGSFIITDSGNYRMGYAHGHQFLSVDLD